MALSDLDRSIRDFRRLRTQREANTARALKDAYGVARDSLTTDLNRLTTWMQEERAAGQEIKPWRLTQELRVKHLLAQAEFAFNHYGRTTADMVLAEQRYAVSHAEQEAHALMDASFGTADVGINLAYVALPQSAITELVSTLGPAGPVRQLLDEFGGQAAKAIEAELIAGLAKGQNPRITARKIRSVLGGQYARALTIARTETLRAHRGATAEVYKANSNLLKGWRWSASLSTRTCATCLALDGRIFPVDTPMRPHPACRCSLSPVTKSWKELGYDVEEPTVVRETGAEWFAKQPAAVQRQMLGPGAHDAYANGEIGLEDFISLRRSKVWGSSYSRGSLAGARERAVSRRLITPVTPRPTAPPPDADREFSYNPDAFKLYRKEQYNAWKSGATPEDITAFKQYKSARYQSVNKYLRTGKATGGQSAAELEQFVKTLDKGLKRSVLEQDVIVQRGIATDPFAIPERYTNLKPGSIMTDKGFVSTTTTKAAEKFAPKRRGSYLFEIRVPKGSTGLNIDPLGDAQTRNEGEILLPRGSKFLIRSVTEERNGRTKIIAELVS